MAINVAVNVSKLNGCVVLGPPKALDVSKASASSVLTNPAIFVTKVTGDALLGAFNLVITKLNGYVVLLTPGPNTGFIGTTGISGATGLDASGSSDVVSGGID